MNFDKPKAPCALTVKQPSIPRKSGAAIATESSARLHGKHYRGARLSFSREPSDKLQPFDGHSLSEDSRWNEPEARARHLAAVNHKLNERLRIARRIASGAKPLPFDPDREALRAENVALAETIRRETMPCEPLQGRGDPAKRETDLEELCAQSEQDYQAQRERAERLRLAVLRQAGNDELPEIRLTPMERKLQAAGLL